MSRRVDLVIFDNDGVLVDSEWHANGILADPLTEYGLPSTRESCIADYLGTSLPTVWQRVERALDRALPVDFERRYTSSSSTPFGGRSPRCQASRKRSTGSSTRPASPRAGLTSGSGWP